ncbi:DoxX family protein [Acidipropionibacterium timonense]|uniref:DoxX family protein n=1 Tax=Acidipropionibacterium timonense TaxID=2161818 RepID=UPI001030DF08|nr:DoxX family protein [Acidipropionibacterium timonense]
MTAPTATPDREVVVHRQARRPLDWIGLLARLALGVTLVVAGTIKATNFANTVLSVRAYRILPWDVAPVVGYAMPILEILVGLALVAGLWTRWSALLGALSMVVFIAGISSAWARGIKLDCGCFGTGGLVGEPWSTVRAGYLRDILRDLGLLVAGLWLVVRPRSPFSLDSWMAPPVLDDTTSPDPS